MTATAGAPGTKADRYKADQPPIPRPRHGDDPTEPGRRHTDQGRQR